MTANTYFEPQFGLGHFLNEESGAILGLEVGYHKNNFLIGINCKVATMGIFWADVLPILSLKAGIRLSKK